MCSFLFCSILKILSRSLTTSSKKSSQILKDVIRNWFFSSLSYWNPDRILEFHGYTFLSGFVGFLVESCTKRLWQSCQDPEKPWLHVSFRIWSFPQEKRANPCRILIISAKDPALKHQRFSLGRDQIKW